MKNSPMKIREIFVESIKNTDETAAFIFEEYADLEDNGSAHFESRFGGETGGFIAEIINIWKSIQPLVGSVANIAGIVAFVITAQQTVTSKKSDKILKDIQRKLDNIDEQSDI